MKALPAKVSKAVSTGSTLVCADNTGAKLLEIIAVKGYRGVKGRYPKAGVGDQVICSVKEGSEKMRKTIVEAVIIRQKKMYRRADGTRIRFDDNAAVLINKMREPVGTEIHGPVAREAVLRYPAIGKIASIVI